MKTAIIIGAGPAGLTAAYKLLTETDIKPIILEETNVIGGISQTVVHNGNRMDIGGHRFFSKNDEVMDFWKQHMPIQGAPAFDDKILGREKPLEKGGPDPEKEDRVMLVRTRVSRIYFLKKFFAYPITMSGETLKNMGFANTMKAGFGYVWSAIFKKKEDNLANFYINRFGKPLYEMFFEDYTEKVWGVNPSNISADWGAQRVKGLSLMKALGAMLKKPFMKKNDVDQKNVETSLIEQFIYPKKGPGQFWETLAHEVQSLGGEIRFGEKVEGIKTENGRVVGVTTPSGTHTADWFFSSMPVKDLVEGMNDVPAEVHDIAAALPYRDFITVGLLVDKLKIKNTTKTKTLGNIVPDCWIYVQERDVRLGRLQIFNNWSPYMVKDPEHTVWIGLEYFCNEGDAFWSASEEETVHQAVSELIRMGVLEDETHVLDSHREQVQKAYPAYFDTYDDIGRVIEYLDSFDNLYCVGRNGQHRYNNMDHSMATSFEAVHNLEAGLRDNTNIWSVNTEQSYHESRG